MFHIFMFNNTAVCLSFFGREGGEGAFRTKIWRLKIPNGSSSSSVFYMIKGQRYPATSL